MKTTVKPVDVKITHKKIASALARLESKGHSFLVTGTVLLCAFQFAACGKGRAVTAGGEEVSTSPSVQGSTQLVQGERGGRGDDGAPGHSPSRAEVVIGMCVEDGMSEADATGPDGRPSEACRNSFHGAAGGIGNTGPAGPAGPAGPSLSRSQTIIALCMEDGMSEADATAPDGRPTEACRNSFHGAAGADGAAGSAGAAGHSPSRSEVIIGMCVENGMSEADATGAEGRPSEACRNSFRGPGTSAEERRRELSMALCGRPEALNAEGVADDRCVDERIRGRNGTSGAILQSCEIQRYHHVFEATPIPAAQLADYRAHNGASSTDARLSLPYHMREEGNARNTARLTIANYHDSVTGAPSNMMTVFDVPISNLPGLDETPSNFNLVLRMQVEKHINTRNVQNNDTTESVCLGTSLRNCSGAPMGQHTATTATASNFGNLLPRTGAYNFLNNIFGEWINQAFLGGNPAEAAPAAANGVQPLRREFVGSMAEVFAAQGSSLSQDQLRNLLYPSAGDTGNTLRFVASDDLSVISASVEVSFRHVSCPQGANRSLPPVDRAAEQETATPQP